jgi:hypothetical protein
MQPQITRIFTNIDLDRILSALGGSIQPMGFAALYPSRAALGAPPL